MCTCICCPVIEVQPADMLAADSYIFAISETLAAISGMKDFFDRTLKRKVSPLKAFLTLRPSLMASDAPATL